MTKSGLIEAIAARMSHLPARDIEVVINTIFDAMIEALVSGDRIEIRGFGSFSVRHRRARTGRNPKTGAAIDVPPKRVPFFTVGHELRQRVNAGAGTAPVEGDAPESPSTSTPESERSSA